MKKFLMCLLCVVMLGSLATATACGCGGSKKPKTTYYTVVFDVDGQAYEELKVKKGGEIKLPETNPQKDGYEFDCWRLNDQSEFVAQGYKVKGNLTILASWTLISYQVVFIADGEEVGACTYTVENKDITYPQVPEKEGYTGEWQETTLTSGDVTLTAVYTPVIYYVIFIADGEEVATETYTVENYGITYPEVPEKPCYSGEWQEVTLTTGNVTIAVDYTLVGHTYGEWISGSPATCEENGLFGHYHCSKCGKDFDDQGQEMADVVDYAHHTLTWVHELMPTCTESGTIGYFLCSVCNAKVDQDGNPVTDITISPLEHNYEWVEEVPATCDEDGEVGHYACSRCGELQEGTGDLTIPAHHAYDESDWEEEIPATCTADGTKGYYFCSVCNKYFDENGNEIDDLTIPASHSYQWIDETPATCTENGEKGHYYCTVCGDIVDEDYQPIADLTIRAGHDEVQVQRQEATCYEDGVVRHFHCTKCGRNTDIQGHVLDDVSIPAHHEYGEWIPEVPAQNGESGTKGHYHCTNGCDKDYDANYVEIADLTIYPTQYTRIDADGNANSEGDYIYFGSYPQTIKANSVTITSEEPEANGYYLGSDGEYYAKVTATAYQGGGYSFSANGTVTNGTVYYFKVEPIKWRILTEDNGIALILCESIISNGQYYQDRNNRGTSDTTIYPNNYKESDIRAWLNDNFYQTAFTALERELIQLTLVDNSARSTNTNNNPTIYNDGENVYACDNTEDYVFLFSTQEVTTEYTSGVFNTVDFAYNIYRARQLSDYALATGAKITRNYNDDKYYGTWMLRSPYTDSTRVRCVTQMGSLDYYEYVNQSYLGVVPALKIMLYPPVLAYSRVDENGVESEEGDYLLYGSYPQTDVTDSMGTALAGYVGDLPTADNANGWTSYVVYSSDAIVDYMWYKDVDHTDGYKYRAVYFTNYRPVANYLSAEAGNSCQYSNGYLTGNVYWFRWDPILWEILYQEEGNAIILAHLMIDSRTFNDERVERTIDGKTVYMNNYKESDIRAWLNSEFYMSAFSELERGIINQITVSNSARSTTYDLDPQADLYLENPEQGNPYACEDTLDYVWLLSRQEVTKEEYGFSTELFDDAKRVKTGTDYALCMGLRTTGSVGNSWRLRSADYYYNSDDYVVRSNENGYVYFYTAGAYVTRCGIVPALSIKL